MQRPRLAALGIVPVICSDKAGRPLDAKGRLVAHHPCRRTRLLGERGSGTISLVVVILVPALVFAAGLVLDGGRQLEARRDAQGGASAAARAAVQYEQAESFADHLDPSLAIRRGHSSLSAEGLAGSVTVSGDEVRVTVSISIDRKILPGSATVTETATATPEDGVNSAGG